MTIERIHRDKLEARTVREILVDVETTGLDPAVDRIVEIAAIRSDGSKLHHLVNPGRPIPRDASRIHGIKDEDVSDKPYFSDIAAEFVAFIGSDRLVAHNAEFDISFINASLERSDMARLANGVVDTLALANKTFPNGRNSLDALCNKFEISRKRRKLHGALLDCELLKEVYDRLLHGDVQGGLDFTSVCKEAVLAKPDYTNRPPRKPLLSEECYKSWTAFVGTIPRPIWNKFNMRKAA